MIEKTIAQYTGASEKTISDLMSKSPGDIYRNQTFLELVSDVDIAALQETMTATRKYLDDALPPIVEKVRVRNKMKDFPLNGYMVCNWLVGYLNAPSQMVDLLNKHTMVPPEVMIDALPDVMAVLAKIPRHANTWQKAFATMAIPLLAR